MKKRVTERIFLDYAAGTDNPNAIYKEGREAYMRLATVRQLVAKVLAVASDEIKLVSWGTEANVSLGQLLKPGDHVVTTSIEHESLLYTFSDLERTGVKVVYVKPDSTGLTKVSDIERALTKKTKLVSVMYANNEIGTIQPIKEIARMLRKQRLVSPMPASSEPREAGQKTSLGRTQPLFHSDCVQAPGLLPVNMQSLGVDVASFSAPKFGGSPGAGFVYVRRSVKDMRLRENVALDLAEDMISKLEKVEKKREKEITVKTPAEKEEKKAGGGGHDEMY